MIGLVGPESPAAELSASIDAHEVVVGEAAAVVEAEPAVVVAVGDDAVCALVRAGVDVPILPVGTSGPLEPIERTRLPAVIDRGLADGFETRARPVLETRLGGETSRAVFDAMLVTAEPARISEYTVEGPGWADRFRADGVVISTAAGSAGYARTLGGPVLDPGTGALAVVPVAAFARRSTVRVADVRDALALTVERDEGDVSLLVDGRSVGLVPPGRPVSVRVQGCVETVIDGGG